MSGATRAAALIVAALLVASCGGGADPAAVAKSAPAPAVVVVRVPGGETTTATRGIPEAAMRIPATSRVVLVTAQGEKDLSAGLGAAGAPCVRSDGQAILFVAKEREGAPYSVFLCDADGGNRRVAVRHDGDCQAAAFLADGRIVYAATLPSPSPVDGARSAQALFVAKGDGAPGARITFGDGHDGDPVVLSDGRVLFASWRARGARGTSESGAFGLFTVHPDGTGLAAFHLAAESVVLPAQTDDLDVRFRRAADGSAHVASWDAPMSAVRPAPADASGEQVVVAPRRRPQGHLSVAKENVAFGTLYCVDARRGADGATAIRLIGPQIANAPIGVVPLAADGSFHVRVPADTPFRIEALAADGRVIVAEHAPIWLRGNETRGCVGCHDDVETAPPNVRPAAVRAAPVDLSAKAGVR